MSLRIVFMGTPAFAAAILAAVLRSSHRVVAVYTQPARPAGRGMASQKSPVQELADAEGLPVLTPASFKGPAEQEAFRSLQPDAAAVAAYGLLLPPPVLDAPRLGCLNVHASLLPRWRGAAPIQRAIMAGDCETGISIMRMEAGLDTGPVALRERVSIPPGMTAGELHDELARLGARLMVEALDLLEKGRLEFTPQTTEGVTYAAKIGKSEGRLDFSQSARDVHNRIRGLSPAPGAWFEAQVGGKLERIKVLRSEMAEAHGRPGEVLDDALTVACGAGAVRLLELQRAGRRPAAAAEFLRGCPLPSGLRLGAE